MAKRLLGPLLCLDRMLGRGVAMSGPARVLRQALSFGFVLGEGAAGGGGLACTVLRNTFLHTHIRIHLDLSINLAARLPEAERMRGSGLGRSLAMARLRFVGLSRQKSAETHSQAPITLR